MPFAPQYTAADFQEMRRLYESGLSLENIAERYECTHATIKYHVEQMGGVIRARNKYAADAEQMRNLYEQGMTLREIGRRYNCCYKIVKKHLQQLDVTIRPREKKQPEPPLPPMKPPAKSLTEEQIQEAIRLYASGKSLREVAARLNHPLAPIRRMFAERGVAMRAGNPSRYTEAQRQEMRRLYESGLSLGAVAQHFGSSVRNVKHHIQRLGGQMRPKTERALRAAKKPPRSEPARRGRKPLLSEEQIHDLMSRYQSGESVSALTSEFGIKEATIYYYLRKHGVAREQKLNSECKAQMIQRFLAGEDAAELVAEYRISRDRFYRVLREAGHYQRRKRTPTAPLETSALTISPARLKSARLKAGLTQAALASKIGGPNADMIRQWERGERRMSGDYLLRFLLATGARPAELIEAPSSHCSEAAGRTLARKYTDEQITDMLRRYEQGEAISEIRAQYGINNGYLHQLRRAAGIAPRCPERSRSSQRQHSSQTEEILTRLRAGESQSELAHEYKISRQRISQIAKDI